MLTKRTNILFKEKTWNALVQLAQKRGASVGQLVRTAVKKTYPETSTQQEITTAYKTITNKRKKFKKLDYKQLIRYGRKH